MRVIYNLPTTVILGFLAIFYGAVFINIQSILRFASENLPLFFGYGIIIFMTILPIGIKGGLVAYHGKRKALKKILYFSGIILVIFGSLILFNTDLSKIWLGFISSEFLKHFHKPFIAFISIGTIYLFYFLLIDIVKVEDFIESIKNMKFVTPIFCFALPAFWKKSLLNLSMNTTEISFLNSLSITSGLIFVIATLTYFVAKHYDLDRDFLGIKNLPNNRKKIYQASLGFFFFGLSLLLFMTVEISYLVVSIENKGNN